MAVGLARTDAIFYSKAKGVGLPVVYLGAKTGRDGIHGATMASAAFAGDAEEKVRPSRSATRSPRNACSRPVSSSWRRAR